MGNVVAVQEVSTEQEEQGSEGNNHSITKDVIWNNWAHKHNKWIGWKKRNEENKQEVKKRASKF